MFGMTVNPAALVAGASGAMFGVLTYAGLVVLLELSRTLGDTSGEIFIVGVVPLFMHYFASFPILYCGVFTVFLVSLGAGFASKRRVVVLGVLIAWMSFGLLVALLPPDDAIVGATQLASHSRARLVCGFLAAIPLVCVGLGNAVNRRVRQVP